MFKKILTGAVAALSIGGAMVATATPAAAQSWNHGGYGGYHHNNTGAVIGAGILGLALGAVIANDRPHYAPAPVYYGPAYGPNYYGGCRPTFRWDPYLRRNVEVSRCY